MISNQYKIPLHPSVSSLLSKQSSLPLQTFDIGTHRLFWHWNVLNGHCPNKVLVWYMSNDILINILLICLKFNQILIFH